LSAVPAIALLTIAAVLLIFIPATISLILHAIYYLCGRRYVEPKPANLALDGVVSILIPVKSEPLEYVDEALKSIYEWGLRELVEVVIVSDDPYEYYLELEKIASSWRAKGLEVYVLWRRFPRGFKAGALNTALWFSRGKYVCVLDVDSRVSRDFVITACSLIRENADVVAVTGRWSGRNSDTRVSEAVSTSMSFVVDILYRGRSALNLPVYPLGSGTIYSARFLKSVLKGWDEKLYLAEDLEIGCRIASLGRRVLFLNSHHVQLDTPRRYSSFRVQQERWVAGTLDVLLSRFPHLLRAPRPWYVKLELMLYLLQYFPAISTFIGTLLLLIPALMHGDVLRPFIHLSIVWSAATGIYGILFVMDMKSKGLGVWRAVVNLGRSSALMVSLTPTFTKAFFKTLLRIRSEFRRTPKGVYESLLAGLRPPVEALIGVSLFMLGTYLLVYGCTFTGLWCLTYSSSFIYATIRWWRDVLFKTH